MLSVSGSIQGRVEGVGHRNEESAVRVDQLDS
jgi:hypothetical protein